MGTHTIARSRQRRQAQRSDAQKVLDCIRQIVRALRVASRASEKLAGLSAAQLFVLECLAELSSASVNELAERTLTHQSSVSAVASKLVERGLISRTRGRDDSRQVELSLSPAAKKLLRKTPASPQVGLIEALNKMGRADVRSLARQLEKFVHAAAISSHPAAMFEEK